MSSVEVLVALVIAVGIVGVVVPVLPGPVLVVGGILVWAADVARPAGWAVFAVAAVWVTVAAVAKYVVPGRRLKGAGIPTTTMLLGGLLGVVGFFVVPVVGLVLGFVLGVYLAELRRLVGSGAWPATRRTLGAVGLAMLIELTGSLLAAATWAVGVVLT